MTIIKTLLICCSLAFALSACSKKKSHGAPAPAQSTVSFYISNNVCYNASTNQQTSTTSCSQLAYYFSGTSCIARSSQQSVDISNCLNLVGRYYIYNNNCWDKTTNTAVSGSHCTTTTTGGSGTPTGSGQYQWNNQVCIDTQTGWVTNIQNCMTGSGGTQCVGNYIYVDYYGYSYNVICNGADCSGAGLYDTRSGQYVMCQ